MKILQEFFVVVQAGAVFRVAQGIPPVATRITAQYGAPVPMGTALQLRDDGATLVGVTRAQGLVAFAFDGTTRDAERVVSKARCWATRPIVAIFLDCDAALQCANGTNLADWDPHWHPASRQTLNVIGDAHPCFTRSPSVLLHLCD